MRSATTDYKEWLQQQDLSALPIFIGMEPNDPDACITLYDLPGASPQQYIGSTKVGSRNDEVQVRVRASDYVAAQACIEAIWERSALLRAAFVSNNEVMIDNCIYRLAPHFLLRDPKMRFVWVCTLKIVRVYV